VAKRKKKARKPEPSMGQKLSSYPSEVFRNKEGKLERRVMIPLDHLEEITSAELARKERLAQGFWARLKFWKRGQTSEEDDGATSEMGGVAASAGGLGLVDDVYDALKEDTTRLSRYEDYRKMDEQCTELSRALSITVSNVFSSREGDQESYKLSSKDAQVQRILEDLDGRVDMQEILPGVCRSGLRYGDEFEEVVVDAAFAIVRLKWLNPEQMTRNEDEYGRLRAEDAFSLKTTAGGVETTVPFNAAQVVHLRHDHQRGDLYGRSFWFSARRPWRLLQPMEDSVVMNRLTRAIDFLAITLPLPEDCDEAEADRLIKKTLRQIKKRRVVDENGHVDWRRAPMPDNADIVIGQPAGENIGRANIQRLGVSGVIGQMEDVKYIQRKMFMSTGVPPSYLGVEESVNAKATLSWEDIQYARIVRHIQREMAWFQREVYDRQLVLLGRWPEKGLYTIQYPPISFVDEEIRMTIENLKWTIFGLARGQGIPSRWLLRRIIGLGEEEIGELEALGQEEPPQQPGQQPPAGAEEEARRRLADDNRLANDVRTLRDMIRVIRIERLNRPVEF